MVSPLSRMVILPNLLNTRGDGGHGQKQNGIDHDSVRKVVEVEEERDEGDEEDDEGLDEGVHDVRLRAVPKHDAHKGLEWKYIRSCFDQSNFAEWSLRY